MNDDATQESLFQDPLGVRLRVAREQAGMTREQVGAKLRLPVAVVDAMEREDWARLGAQIYVRSYVGGYLKLLGLPDVLLEQARREQPAPTLVTLAPRSRMRHTFDASLRNVVYLVMTAVLVVPVVLVARHYQARDRVQELTLDAESAADSVLASPSSAAAPPPGVTSAPPRAVASPAAPAAAADAAPDPVMASMTPFPKAARPSSSLVLSFRDESWIDVVGADGARVERGLVAAGEERRYDAGQVSRVTLGNADGVDVRHAGVAVDLAPFRSANVARFAVSSDGVPAPAAN